jgi:hypothetical protein
MDTRVSSVLLLEMLYYPKIKQGKQLIEFTSSITFRGSPLQCSELARRKFVQAPSSQDQKHWLISIQNLVSFHASYTATFKAQYYPAIWPDLGLFLYLFMIKNDKMTCFHPFKQQPCRSRLDLANFLNDPPFQQRRAIYFQYHL